MNVRVAFVVCVAGAAAACSLGAFDGFSGGAPEDAGVGVDVDASSADVGTNPGNDGSTTGDAGADGPFCASLGTAPYACADFDDGKIPFRFTNNSGDAAVSIDDQGSSGTKGMKAYNAPNATSSDSACIQVALDSTRKSITLEADVRLDVVGTGDFDVLNVRFDASHEMSIHVESDSLYFEQDIAVVDGGPPELYKKTTGTLAPTYRRLRFVSTIDGAVAHVQLFVDGTSVGTYDADSKTVQGKVSAHFGDCTFAAARGWTLHYDNVVVYETL